MPKPTKDQQTIIDTLDHPLFVAAGAGSGKSSTLAARVEHALRSGYITSLDQALVITFTHAAAEEIREKIRGRLRSAGLERNALEVDAAWISTIHGMCSRILHTHAFDLGLDPNFKLVGETEAAALQEGAIDAVLRRLRDEGSYPQLFAAYKARSKGYNGEESPTSVFGMVGKLRKAAAESVAGFDSLEFPGSVPQVGFEVQGLLDVVENVLDAGRRCGAFESSKGQAEQASLVGVAEALKRYLALPPSKRPDGRADLLRALPEKPGDAYRKKAMKPLKGELAEAYSGLREMVAFAQAAPFAGQLVEIAREVDGLYRQAKDAEGLLDNDDLLTLALDAFRTHPDIAAEYSDRFRLVMIDEFQDTNQQQVEMIELLSGPGACHLCTVGDAQQSIYRFRGADVSVFENRERDMDAATVRHMDVNFRSHRDVLHLVDQAFSGGFLPGFMSLVPCDDYEGEEEYHRLDGYRALGQPRVAVELTVGGGKAEDRRAVSAEQVAQRLSRYVGEGKHGAGDVALLLGSLHNVGVYLDALRAHGIECVVTGGSTFSQAPEVATVAALLHVLANPGDTKAGLYPVLASGLFALDADDFLALSTRQHETTGLPANRPVDDGLWDWGFMPGYVPSERMVLAREVLERAVSRMGSWRVGQVMEAVLEESGWLARLERKGPQGLAVAANALAAVRYAGELAEADGLGPSRAAVEFDAWLDLAKKSPAALSGGEAEVAKVMTVHASKGLEFPVVAVAECWGKDASPEAGVTYESVGSRTLCTLVPPEVDLKRLSAQAPDEPPTSGDRADWGAYLATRAAQADAAESVRLLYVALTRAREALVCGMAVQVKDGGFGTDFMAQLGRNLFGEGVPDPGEETLELPTGVEVGLRCVLVEKDKSTKEVTLDGGGAFEMPQPEETGEETFVQVVSRPGLSQLAEGARPWPSRPGTYSFSSVHEALAEESRLPAPPHTDIPATPAPAPEAPQPARPPRLAEQDDADDAEWAAGPSDSDRATDLGSAFHELAQAMVEAGHVPTSDQVYAMERTWHLSVAQRARLEEAIRRWEGSDLRKEALSHGRVLAEVPFFCERPSDFGQYMEGAIDLLATDEGSSSALVVDYKTGDAGLALQGVRERHQMQAELYADVLMRQGFSRVECAFVCVERDVGEVGGQEGQPIVVRYAFGG